MSKNAINVVIIYFSLSFYIAICFSRGVFANSTFADDGLISLLTLMVIQFNGCLCLWHALRTTDSYHRIQWFLLLFVLQVYFLREADLHKIFDATYTLTHPKFYLDAYVPLMGRLISGLVMGGCVAGLGFLGLYHAPRLLAGLRNRQPWCIALVLWGGLLFTSQVFDHLPINTSNDWRLRGIEEMMEFTAAMYALVAMVTFSQHRRGRAVAD